MPTIWERFKRRLTTGQREREDQQRQQSIQTPLQTQQLPEGILTEEQRLQSVERQPNILTGGGARTPAQRLQSFEGQPQAPTVPTGQGRKPVAQAPTFHMKSTMYSAKTPHPTTGAVDGATLTLEFSDDTSRSFEATEAEWAFMNENSFTVAPSGNQDLADFILLKNEQEVENAIIRGDNAQDIINAIFKRNFAINDPEMLERLKMEVLMAPQEWDTPEFIWTADNFVQIAQGIILKMGAGAVAGFSGGPTSGITVPVGIAGGFLWGMSEAPKIIQTNRDSSMSQVRIARQLHREFMARAVNDANQGTGALAIADFENAVWALMENEALGKEATTGMFGQELRKGQEDLYEIRQVILVEVPYYRRLLLDGLANPNSELIVPIPTGTTPLAGS